MRPRRLPLDGPLIEWRAQQGGRCAVCTRRYPAGVRVTWLVGSGPCHAQCRPPRTDAGLLRAAEVAAGYAADVGELREVLEALGLLAAPARRRAAS